MTSLLSEVWIFEPLMTTPDGTDCVPNTSKKGFLVPASASWGKLKPRCARNTLKARVRESRAQGFPREPKWQASFGQTVNGTEKWRKLNVRLSIKVHEVSATIRLPFCVIYVWEPTRTAVRNRDSITRYTGLTSQSTKHQVCIFENEVIDAKRNNLKPAERQLKEMQEQD